MHDETIISRNKNNVYAKNLKGIEIHISEAPSGAQGYFCLGCDQPLQAVQQTTTSRISFFRHIATEVTIERKCVYSDETHRHKLAKILLLQNKFIKVPAIYKYPPKGGIGLANLLHDAEIIEAHSIKVETTFYEDLSGTIHWGPNEEVDERFLTVVPDIAFFNIKGEPILFIELVATHAVNFEKSAKLKRLGINTIQVKIPRDSAEAIENSFKTTANTKWIYNYVESNAQYIFVPPLSGEGISSVDEQQRKLLEESFKCRKSQISNLIRTVTRCLESQLYGNIESELRRELSRVEANTSEHQSRLDALREEYRERAIERVSAKQEEFDKEYDSFECEASNYEQGHREVEIRYNRKKADLDGEERDVDQKVANFDNERNGEVEIEGRNGNSIESRGGEIKRLSEELRENIRLENDRFEQVGRDEQGLPNRYDKLRDTISRKFDKLTKSENDEIEKIRRGEESLPTEFRLKEEFIPGEIREEEKLIDAEFEREREQTSKTILSRDSKGNTKLHQRIRGILASRETLNDIEQKQIDCKRNRTAWDYFNKGTYENWVE